MKARLYTILVCVLSAASIASIFIRVQRLLLTERHNKFQQEMTIRAPSGLGIDRGTGPIQVGDVVKTFYSPTGFLDHPFYTTVTKIEHVGPRSQTGLMVYTADLPALDSWWVAKAVLTNADEDVSSVSSGWSTNGTGLWSKEGFTGRLIDIDSALKTTNVLLFDLQVDGASKVRITKEGNVIYDTNNVSEATRLFWNELSRQAKEEQ